MKAVTIEGENGVPCTSTATQHRCWRRHFSKVLNVRSPFDDRELGQVRQQEVDQILGEIPTSYNVKKALGKLKGGKQGRRSRGSNCFPKYISGGAVLPNFSQALFCMNRIAKEHYLCLL